MNQREALLAGAKRCLAEKGYGHTTARDIAAVSGAHLGSIGYHFGSKDRLMNTAAVEASGEWGDTVELAARSAGGASPAERLSTLLAALLAAIPGSRELQSASLQALAQAPFDEHLRGELASARAALAAVVLGVPSVERGSPEDRGLGSLVGALVTGLIAQAAVDPDSLPDPEHVVAAIRSIAEVPPAVTPRAAARSTPSAGR